ncbi:MAG: putative toxin-antitoxin system toxin component, PIN family [Muribaculaceae bacterium]|nr:putative toxin-antitoxin system toxin component, PIN family [Muribaculaceae bacterium]
MKRFYAVIDTNVIVSALISSHSNAATVLMLKYVFDGNVIPLFNEEILEEYKEVLKRKKFKLPDYLINTVIETIKSNGIFLGRTKTTEAIPDDKDIVFYEVKLSKEDSFLITGNIKHFPKTPFVVTPSEMLNIINESNNFHD